MSGHEGNTFAARLSALLAEKEWDALELARRLSARPWHDGPLTAEQERGWFKSVETWQRQIRRWLKGRSEPRSIAQIRLVAAALDTTVDELFPKEAEQ